MTYCVGLNGGGKPALIKADSIDVDPRGTLLLHSKEDGCVAAFSSGDWWMVCKDGALMVGESKASA